MGVGSFHFIVLSHVTEHDDITDQDMMSVVLPAILSVLAPLVTGVTGDYVGQSVSGDVEAGNYTYYTLRQTGHVMMVLTSHLGDADLYISDASNERPTFMFDEHQLSSTTCGQDTVDIPASFLRPVNIAVYGHPNYIHSKFTLDGVIIEEEEYDPFQDASFPDDEQSEEEVKQESGDKKTGGRQRRQSDDSWLDRYFREGSPARIMLTVLGGILEILLEILL